MKVTAKQFFCESFKYEKPKHFMKTQVSLKGQDSEIAELMKVFLVARLQLPSFYNFPRLSMDSRCVLHNMCWIYDLPISSRSSLQILFHKTLKP